MKYTQNKRKANPAHRANTPFALQMFFSQRSDYDKNIKLYKLKKEWKWKKTM